MRSEAGQGMHSGARHASGTGRGTGEADMDPGKLFIEFLFGMVGTGYFIYGRKQSRYLFLGCGLGLGLFPYFVDSMWAILLAGAVLVAVPFFIRD
jgi:hypothetical protein